MNCLVIYCRNAFYGCVCNEYLFSDIDKDVTEIESVGERVCGGGVDFGGDPAAPNDSHYHYSASQFSRERGGCVADGG